MESQIRWSLDARFALRFCAWENEDYGVVYNKTTGNTHSIGVLGISILANLSEKEFLTERSIIKQIESDLGEQGLLLPDALVSDSLLELKELELVITS